MLHGGFTAVRFDALAMVYWGPKNRANNSSPPTCTFDIMDAWGPLAGGHAVPATPLYTVVFPEDDESRPHVLDLLSLHPFGLEMGTISAERSWVAVATGELASTEPGRGIATSEVRVRETRLCSCGRTGVARQAA